MVSPQFIVSFSESFGLYKYILYDYDLQRRGIMYSDSRALDFPQGLRIHIEHGFHSLTISLNMKAQSNKVNVNKDAIPESEGKYCDCEEMSWE